MYWPAHCRKEVHIVFLECRKSTTHSAFFKEALGVENLKNVASRYVRPSLCLTVWGVSRKSWWRPCWLILQSSSKQGAGRNANPKPQDLCILQWLHYGGNLNVLSLVENLENILSRIWFLVSFSLGWTRRNWAREERWAGGRRCLIQAADLFFSGV